MQLWSPLIPSKKWTLEFCRILKGSYSKKNWQYNKLTNYLLARLKHYKDHLVCILKTIFACKSFICVRLFVFFMLQTALMSRIDLVSKNLLANCFRNFSKKRFKENCYQKNREEIANVTKIAKVRRIFLAICEKIE